MERYPAIGIVRESNAKIWKHAAGYGKVSGHKESYAKLSSHWEVMERYPAIGIVMQSCRATGKALGSYQATGKVKESYPATGKAMELSKRHFELVRFPLRKRLHTCAAMYGLQSQRSESTSAAVIPTIRAPAPRVPGPGI